MPSKGGVVGAVEFVVGVHEAVQVVGRLLVVVAGGVQRHLLARSERVLRAVVVEDGELVVVDLYSVGEGPHFIVGVVVVAVLSRRVASQYSHSDASLEDVLNGEV